jgi:hypothetical protein
MITFANGYIARAVEATPETDPQYVLASLELEQLPRGVISISGGASAYPPGIVPQTKATIQALVEFAFEYHVALIDGGTATGVMQVLGECFANTRRLQKVDKFPLLIGFVPHCMVTYPGAEIGQRSNCLAQLDPNHPYFVLLAGVREWGDEVDSMFRFVAHLASEAPSIAIVANGGLTTLKEAMVDIAHGREIIVLEGSQRAGEAIIARMDGRSGDELEEILYRSELVKPDHPEQVPQIIAKLDALVESGYLTRFPLGRPPSELVELVASRLVSVSLSR